MSKKKRSRKVNFEGRQIPESKLPNGSLFIINQWYSSARKLPARLKKIYGLLFRASKGNNSVAPKSEADRTIISIDVPAVDTRSIGDLVSELNRIEKQERQLRGFSKYYWNHMDEQNLENDKGQAQLYYQTCAKLFGITYTSYPDFIEAKQLLEKHKTSLGVALMKMTYYVEEEGSGDNHRIILHMHHKSMQLPRDKIDGRWYSQEEYIKLCVRNKKAKSAPEMYEKLRRTREENRGNFDWAEDLTPDGYRWGKDIDGRVLKKINKNLPPFYFATFKEFPMLIPTIGEAVDDSNNDNVLAHEFDDKHQSDYQKLREQKIQFRSQ